MTIRVTLFASNDHIEAGKIEFRTLLVDDEHDYVCRPTGLLSLYEVQQVCQQLRHLPQIHSGSVGRYEWLEK